MGDGIKAYYEELEQKEYEERFNKIEKALRTKDVGQFIKDWDNLISSLDKLYEADLSLTRYQHSLLREARESVKKLLA